jgi:O-methyltransferase.
VQTEWVLEALRGHDFSAMSHLCDIGGGQGHLLSHLLARHPHLSGTVLERPSVAQRGQVPWAEKLELGDRCRYAPGDMFVDVPPADGYVMKMILHDWNDEECIRILANASRRAPPHARMFIVEHVIPEKADGANFATLFDIHMMCWGTGRERTALEYASLLREAGWNPVGSWFPESGVIGVIEGAKA